MAIAGLFTLLRFSNGRRYFVLKQVLKVATELGNARIMARTEAAIEHERQLRSLERRWLRTKGNRSKARGEAKAIDARIDRLLSAIHSTVQSVLSAIDPQSDHAAFVRDFLANYFPNGVQEISNAEFEDELSMIQEMNEEFARMSEDEIAKLNLSFHVPELARLTSLFAAELNRPEESHTIRFATVRAAREQGHEKLLKLVATILAEYDEEDGTEAAQAQAALLAPILAANERVAQRRRRKNGPDVDVDPTTGEELEEGMQAEDDADEDARNESPS